MRHPHPSFDFTLHDFKVKDIAGPEGTIDEKQGMSGYLNVERTARYGRKVKFALVVCGQ